MSVCYSVASGTTELCLGQAVNGKGVAQILHIAPALPAPPPPPQASGFYRIMSFLVERIKEVEGGKSMERVESADAKRARARQEYREREEQSFSLSASGYESGESLHMCFLSSETIPEKTGSRRSKMGRAAGSLPACFCVCVCAGVGWGGGSHRLPAGPLACLVPLPLGQALLAK